MKPLVMVVLLALLAAPAFAQVGPSVPTLPFESVPHEFVPQMQNFVRAIHGLEPPINSSIQAVQLMEMLDAIYHSSLTGNEVRFG